MHRSLINIFKKNKIFYTLYYWIGTVLINILKIFVSVDNKVILFNSFGGRKYDDSPKVLYEAMIKDKRYKGYKFYWAFNNPSDYSIEKGKKLKIDSLKYFIIALKARVWITNTSIERGLSYKRKETLYFNTWHGTPIKKLGKDLLKTTKSFKSKKSNSIDIMTVQGKYDANIFAEAFNINKNKFLFSGLPRNDILSKYSNDYKKEIISKLNLSSDKKVILYAPTYREYEKDNLGRSLFKLPFNLDTWQRELGDNHILLLRLHYESILDIDIEKYKGFVVDVSSYSNLNDLMIASDLLISDYSSMFFDYSILNKPMICYTYDFEKYNNLRGLYFDLRKDIPGGSISEKKLLLLIKYYINNNVTEEVKKFRNNYVEFYGEATTKSLDYIESILNK